MKKFISFIIALIVLSSCIGITSFATSYDVTLSEDFSELYTDSKTYTMVDASMFQPERIYNPKQVILSDSQKETVKSVTIYSDSDDLFFFADIKYFNGMTLSISYLDNNYMDDYVKITGDEIDTYTIDFMWPYKNTVKADKELLSGTEVTLKGKTIDRSSYYDVFIESGKENFRVLAGAILINGDDCYYVDFKEIGFDVSNQYAFSIYDYSVLEAHKIEDTALLNKIFAAQDKYHSDDLGFFYDDDFTETISLILMVFLFAVIPLIIFILFLILAIRSKTVYRKFFSAVYILSAAELIVFAIIATCFVLL